MSWLATRGKDGRAKAHPYLVMVILAFFLLGLLRSIWNPLLTFLLVVTLIGIIAWHLLRRHNTKVRVGLSLFIPHRTAARGETLPFEVTISPSEEITIMKLEAILRCRQSEVLRDEGGNPYWKKSETGEEYRIVLGENERFKPGKPRAITGEFMIPSDATATDMEGDLTARWRLRIVARLSFPPPATVEEEVTVVRTPAELPSPPRAVPPPRQAPELPTKPKGTAAPSTPPATAPSTLDTLKTAKDRAGRQGPLDHPRSTTPSSPPSTGRADPRPEPRRIAPEPSRPAPQPTPAPARPAIPEPQPLTIAPKPQSEPAPLPRNPLEPAPPLKPAPPPWANYTSPFDKDKQSNSPG